MLSRKKFLKNIGAGMIGLTVAPSISLGHEMAKKKSILIVLDTICKRDFIDGFLLTKKATENYNTKLFNNIFTTANLDFHHESCSHIFKDDAFDVINLSSSAAISNNSTRVLLTGFDVAHYNHNLYLDAIANADKCIADFILKNSTQLPIIVMSAMGRNDFENDMVFGNGSGGTHHNHVQARECFAFKVMPLSQNKYANCVDEKRQTTSSFMTDLV